MSSTPPRRRRSWRGAIAAVLALAVIALLVAVAVWPTTPSVRLLDDNYGLPSNSLGCSGATNLGGGAARVPITVSRSGTSTALFATLCLDGQGPFPFIIDTGAAKSVVDGGLAARLKLARSGPSQAFNGIGCSGTTQPVQMASWSVSGLALAPQTIWAQSIPGLGGRGEADGLLGADVLSRFGAIRFDFVSQTMTVPGPEQPAPTSRTEVSGPTAAPIPPVLTDGQPTQIFGVTVVEGPAGVLIATTVRFSGTANAEEFAVDTGSTRSLIDQSLAHALSLQPLNESVRTITACSKITVPLVRSGPWSAGQVSFAQVVMARLDLGGLGSVIRGTIGSDELNHFQYAIIDFQGARIVLGPRQA